MAGTLDPLIHRFVGLRRQMVHSYTQGIVTKMAYVCVNIFYLYDSHRKAKTAAHAFGSMQMF